jgi:hypothetical protein
MTEARGKEERGRCGRRGDRSNGNGQNGVGKRVGDDQGALANGKKWGVITCLSIMQDARVQEEGDERGACWVDQWCKNCWGVIPGFRWSSVCLMVLVSMAEESGLRG